MKNCFITLIACAFVLQSSAQGTLQTNSGAYIKTTLNAYIVLDNINFINNGNYTQAIGDGTTKLTGAINTSTSGTGVTSVDNLEIAIGSSTTHTLSAPISVKSVVTPTSGVLAANGNLTLLSTNIAGGGAIAAGSSSGGYITGAVTVQRYSQAQRGYRTLSHPYTTAQAISQLTDNIRITGLIANSGLYGVASGAAQAFNYVPTGLAGNASQILVPITDATATSWGVGKALYLFVRGNANEGMNGPGAASYNNVVSPVTLDVSGGIVNQGDVAVSLGYGSLATDNYNLIGNPYPCPINLKNVTGLNVGTVYVYNPRKNYGSLPDPFSIVGGFDSYMFVNGVTDITVPIMGGFYIKTIMGGQSVTFKETDKFVSATPTYTMFGTNKYPLITLKVTTPDGDVDEVKIGFDANASSTANDIHDAPKLNNSLFNFYSISSDNKQLAIDYRNDKMVDSIIQLGIKTNINRTYTISVAEFRDMPTSQLLLRDKLLNKVTPLTQIGDRYTFNITTDTLTKGNNRFELGLLGATVLPTKLTSITAQLHTNNKVAVNWVSATEVNADYYQVQRSTNNSDFSNIGKVAAKGASSYTYNDDLNSINYQLPTVFYRLQMFDKDGSFTYSKVVSCQLQIAGKALSIYPNPVQTTLFVQVFASTAETFSVSITDMQGKIIIQQNEQVVAGRNAISIPTNALAAGTYLLVINGKDGQQQQQFVKL